MPVDEINYMNEIAAMPGENTAEMPPAEMPMEEPSVDTTTPPTSEGSQLGGPGIDTPQEKAAIAKLIQGGIFMRQATQHDPSIRYILDQHLEKMFLDIANHYGVAEEGKLALKQAKMRVAEKRRNRLAGPPIG